MDTLNTVEYYIPQPIDHSIFKCPFTLLFFLSPVLAEDGHFYEKKALKKWFKKSTKSPLTGVNIGTSMISCVFFNNMLKDYLLANPDKLAEQFVDDFSNDVFYQLFGSNRIDELIAYISEYDTFCLQVSAKKNPCDKTKVFENEQITKILIDKNVSVTENPSRFKLIHWVCRYSTPDMIQYIIDKGVDLECPTRSGKRPVHLICQHSTDAMIKYIIDKGVNLECADHDGWRPIHVVCLNAKAAMIKYIIDKDVDLECSTKFGLKPIQLIHQFAPTMLQYIIDKGVNLGYQTV
jgi:hypothetical protein